MKLDTLKTIESALNDAIRAERAKAEAAKEHEANSRISELRAALKDFISISWRE